MNIVFFGSAHFGLPSLKALINAGHKITCVVTQPDRKKGRGMGLAKTPIKEFAQENSLTVYQPENINTAESVALLKNLNSDLFVVIAYGQLLSRQLLDIPAIMPLNVHASILPFYRGAAPINWAIIKGETKTGVTIIKMAEKMDAGPMIATKETAINPEDDFFSLEARLSELGAALLNETIVAIAANNYRLIEQDENKATFAPKLKKENGLINWSCPANEVYDLIRGLSGWPAAFTYYKGKLLKLLRAEISGLADSRARPAPGEIIAVSKDNIAVATKKGSLLVKILQIEGKRQMTAQEFITGHKTSSGDRFLDRK
ncbi:MAG: methionyl-tRNA formyltransferase [Candidatus Omnitrophota bacterium]